MTELSNVSAMMMMNLAPMGSGLVENGLQQTNGKLSSLFDPLFDWLVEGVDDYDEEDEEVICESRYYKFLRH